MSPPRPLAPGSTTRLAVRAYLVATRMISRVFRAANGCFHGIVLGLGSERLFHAIDEHFYNEWVGYTDDAYNLKDLSGWEEAAIQQHFPAEGRVVVTAAGGGREVIALRRRGLDVDGFECNPKLAEYGTRLLRDQGHDGQVSLAPRDRWPAPDGSYAGAVVGWGSYMLIPGRDRRIAFLRGARACLPDGAPVLVSFFHRKADNGYFRVVRAVGGLLRRVRGRAPVEMGDCLVPNYAHYFTRAEIAGELAAAGFQMVDHQTRPYAHAVGIATPRNGDPSGRSPATREQEAQVLTDAG